MENKTGGETYFKTSQVVLIRQVRGQRRTHWEERRKKKWKSGRNIKGSERIEDENRLTGVSERKGRKGGWEERQRRCKKGVSWVNKTCMRQSLCVHLCAFHLHVRLCLPFRRRPSLSSRRCVFSTIYLLYVIPLPHPYITSFHIGTHECLYKYTWMFMHACTASSGSVASSSRSTELL